MEYGALEKTRLIPYSVSILTKAEEYKKIVPELPSYYVETLQDLYDTISKEVAEPLLQAENLKEKFQKLRDPFSLLRICLNSYIGYMVEQCPKETERLFRESVKWVETTAEDQAGLLLDEETAEILRGILHLCIRSSEDSLKLLQHLDMREFPSTLYGIAINLDLSVLSVLSSLMEELIVGKREKQNLRTLILWAREYSLEYTNELSQFLKRQLSRPQNVELGKEFYTEKIREFIGSGPKGVYEALLEERQRERGLRSG